MKDDLKFFVKWCEVEMDEDSYEKGELGHLKTFDLGIDGQTFDSLEELIGELSSCGFTDNIEDYGFFDANGGEIITDMICTRDMEEPSEKELESWRNGEIMLYTAHLSCGVELVAKRPMTEKDAKELGLEIY